MLLKLSCENLALKEKKTLKKERQCMKEKEKYESYKINESHKSTNRESPFVTSD